ncbi:MAG: hypothetical protein IKL98_00255 [Akkermansia sp.]|nr:hypothetical protein [Akkermansia sp.]
MQSIISTQGEQWQAQATEWYGQPVEPPYEYSFTATAEGLLFQARRHAAALVHPQGQCGQFQAELWRYDAAEFFISTPAGDRYMEFNLSPNGAWWACLFQAPLVVAQGYEAWQPAVQATGHASAEGWQCRALISAASLQEAGICLQNCKLAACAILNSPQQIFLTTALPCNTQPDFHRPDLWQTAAYVEG